MRGFFVAFGITALMSLVPLSGVVAANADPWTEDEVDAKNLDVCQFIAAEQGIQTYRSRSQTRDSSRDNRFLADYFIHYGWVDLDGDGIPEQIKRAAVNGTMGGDAYDIDLSSAPKSPAGVNLSPDNDNLPKDVSDYLDENRVTLGEAFLPFKGRFYDVAFTDEEGAFVMRADYYLPGGASRTACAFKNTIESDGWTDDYSSPVFKPNKAVFGPSIDLDALLKNPIAATDRLPKPAPASSYSIDMPGGPIQPACEAAEGVCKDIWQVDFDNDGVKDRLLLLKGESGAGRGCDVSFFVLLTKDGAVANGAKQDLLLRLQNVDLADAYPVRPCEMEFRWHKVAGQTMLERRSSVQPPYHTWELVDDLWMAKDGQTGRLVSYQFRVKPEIIYDAAPK